MPVKKKSVAKAKVKVKMAAKPKASAAMLPSSLKDPMTKADMLKVLAAHAELTKKQVTDVLDGFVSLIETHIKKRGPGMFTMPGIMKVYVARKPATKERKGVNPFTGQNMIIKAKPARNVVKIKALKKLKGMCD